MYICIAFRERLSAIRYGPTGSEVRTSASGVFSLETRSALSRKIKFGSW